MYKWLDASVRRACVGTLALRPTYLHSWMGHMKLAISSKRFKIERKLGLLLTAYIKLHTGFQLPACAAKNV